MFSALKFNLSNPNCNTYSSSLNSATSCLFPYHLRLPIRRQHLPVTVLSHYESSTPPPAESEPSISSEYIASVGSSTFSYPTLHLSQRHMLMLNVTACAVAISATWLFLSAIPTLLAFKRAAESLEKLMDATREELPDTMAAIRLSGMEISDLTMELSDLGQEITQGVRSSTRAVRLAEERLRGLTNMAPPALLQRVASPKTQTRGPAVAKTARGIREGIVKGRTFLQLFFTVTRFSRMALNYFAKRAKR